jgi:alkaline phosphatase
MSIIANYYAYNPRVYFLNLIDGQEPATDSASAGTAISTGQKTDAGNIAWASGDPAGGELTTIAETLRNAYDFAIGVASTVPFSHATPAAFASHNVARSNKWNIAHEILFEVQPEIVIGGGLEGYFQTATQDQNGENKDLDDNGYNDDYDAFVAGTDGTDYTFVERTDGIDGGDALATTAATLDINSGDKLFGLFGTSGGNFEYFEVADNPGNPAITRGVEDPTLAEVTNVTLSMLNQDPDGFFVMFEQGDIDWNNHANDFENMIGGIYDLEEAVLAAQAFVDSGVNGINWSNTLMMVTSDHSNSYMRNQQLLGAGDLPEQEGEPYNFSYPNGEITYETTNHTNEPVTISARGVGADLFNDYAGSWYPHTNLVDNTQIYEVMMEAVQQGVEHIILFIGDGMNIEHEIAGSNYLYGKPNQLAWHDWDQTQSPNGYEGFVTTWDVDTYNKYASANGLPLYNPENFNPMIGYDPCLGGDYKVIEGTDNHDHWSIIGSQYANTTFVFASNGDDDIVGGFGKDLICGGEGNDEIDGNKGSDRLYGGLGSDIFIMIPGNGSDIIGDFEVGVDLIGLSGGIGFDDLDFSGSNIILRSTGETLATLAGVDALGLTEANFTTL